MSGNTLYAGGSFTTAGGNTANYIAQWDGSSWSGLGSGLNAQVNALAVSGGTLYVGGNFTTAGGTAANYIAQWNGSSWSPLGSGMNANVYSVTASGGTVYVGGKFTTAGDNTANYLAQWNGSSWSAVGSGIYNDYTTTSVNSLMVSGGTLYTGGMFTKAGGKTVNYIAQWNGSSWSALGSGVGGVSPSATVDVLAISGGTLYAVGYFTTAGDQAANHVAQWNGSSWSPLGAGTGGGLRGDTGTYVSALTVSGGTLYVGGQFTTAGGNGGTNIAQWNGSAWSPLGSGMGHSTGTSGSTPVTALAVLGTNLYAGGWFTKAGGNTANRIAQWDGSSWSPLGSGMNNAVLALAVSGGTLYAGGMFTTAGGKAAPYVAQWDGSSWSAVGSGMNGSVYALAVSGGTLYVGGRFTTAGGNAAINIAKWDGSSWSALGSGLSGNTYYPPVASLAVSGTNLYAGGWFRTAGGNPANYIAQWDGSSWSSLGSGMEWKVGALAVFGSTLYAGGSFVTAGGNPANYIAQWDGSSWSPLGSGMNRGAVSALAVSAGTLYAGGGFTTAGGKVSAYVAAADLVGPEFQNGPVPNTDGSMTLNCCGRTNASSCLYAATNLTPPVLWQPVCTNTTGGLWQFTDTNASGNPATFYRLSIP